MLIKSHRYVLYSIDRATYSIIAYSIISFLWVLFIVLPQYMAKLIPKQKPHGQKLMTYRLLGGFGLLTSVNHIRIVLERVDAFM